MRLVGAGIFVYASMLLLVGALGAWNAFVRGPPWLVGIGIAVFMIGMVVLSAWLFNRRGASPFGRKTAEEHIRELEEAGQLESTAFRATRAFGVEESEDEGLHYFLELTGPGTGRVVLTNLFNRTQPLIRYELGDVITCGPGTADSPFKTVAIVAGEVLDALPISRRDGTTAAIDGLTLRSLFSVRGLETLQFVSRPDRVRIVYVGEENLDEVLRRKFQALLDGRSIATTVETERVAHIPVDPRTGKHRQVVEER
jgi:hypothetical protein